MCQLLQIQFQLGRCIHEFTNQTYYLTRLIPTLASINISNTNQPKYGINLVELLQNVFHFTWLDVTATDTHSG